MPSRKHKSCLVVLGQGVRGWPVTLESVAPFTGVEVWRSRELPSVLVAVAVGAVCKLQFEQSVPALGNMTLRAGHRGVLRLQRIRRRGMIFYGEGGRLESIHRVAGRALAAVRAFCELAAMRVRLVAVHAFLKSQRLLEIAACMALRALDSRMFPQQWIFSLGMIEILIQRSCADPLPAARVMAGLAALREASVVWVAMAIGALSKGNPDITGLVVWTGSVAFLAGHLYVQTVQRIFGLGVVELANIDRFPVVEAVTMLAVRSQPAIVLVLVAGCACGRNSKECSVQVFDLDRRSLRWRNMISRVTAIAGQSGVLAFQCVSGLFVIEGLEVPLD